MVVDGDLGGVGVIHRFCSFCWRRCRICCLICSSVGGTYWWIPTFWVHSHGWERSSTPQWVQPDGVFGRVTVLPRVRCRFRRSRSRRSVRQGRSGHSWGSFIVVRVIWAALPPRIVHRWFVVLEGGAECLRLCSAHLARQVVTVDHVSKGALPNPDGSGAGAHPRMALIVEDADAIWAKEGTLVRVGLDLASRHGFPLNPAPPGWWKSSW